MKKVFLFTAVIFSFGVIDQARSAELVNLSLQEVKSFHVQGARNLKDFAQNLSAVLLTSPGESLAVRSQAMDNGIMHVRYYMSYKGVRIWPQEIAASMKDGQLHRLNGVQVKGIAADLASVTPRLKSAKALAVAKKNFLNQQAKSLTAKNEVFRFERSTSDLRVFVDEKTQVAKLAYLVSFFADTAQGGHPHRALQVIDANTGKTLMSIENLQTSGESEATGPGGNLKTGKYIYGKDFPALAVTVNETGICVMTTEKYTTINLKHSSGGSLEPYSFNCPENTFEAINGAYSPLNDAQFYAGVIEGLYNDWYQTSPLQIPLLMKVHYSKNYENAYWDGSSMTFGDGKNTFYPLVSLDVSSHEIAHGFTEFNSNLAYYGQSGGMNEAFSDMAGEAAEFYAKNTNDFLVGAEIFKQADQALRYMSDPPKDGRSIGSANDYYSGLDVHYSSGVYNKAFYSLATTKGWNTKMAFDVFVKANQHYWTSSAKYTDGAKGVRDAALDLGYPADDVVAAFAKVDIAIPN